MHTFFPLPSTFPRLRSLFLGLFLLVSQPAFSASKVLINDDVESKAIDSTFLSQVFAMQIRKWPNGVAIHVYTLPTNSQQHRQFVIEKLKIQTHQLDRIWNRMLFTGTGKAPTVVNTEREMVEVIRSQPGAVGYVSREYPAEGVRVLEEVQ